MRGLCRRFLNRLEGWATFCVYMRFCWEAVMASVKSSTGSMPPPPPSVKTTVSVTEVFVFKPF